MSDTTPEHLLKRYEDIRRCCLSYANFHPDDKSVCHQSLSKVLRMSGVNHALAELVDDMAIYLRSKQP